MKQITLLTVFSLFSICSWAQFRPLPSTSDAKQDTSRVRYWAEYNTGGFGSGLSAPGSNTNLVLRTTLYDTGRGGPPPTIVMQGSMGTSNLFSTSGNDNATSITNGTSLVYINTSVPEVMARDTMVLAVTYRTDTSGFSLVDTAGKIRYTLVLLYNPDNGPVFFEPLNGSMMNGYSILPMVRSHNNESIDYGTVSNLQFANINASYFSGYANYVAFRNIIPQLVEKNVFISVVPSATLAEGTLGSVKAVLIRNDSLPAVISNTYKDAYQLSGLRVALAHDPNYLRVTPLCIESTKRGGHIITYKVHFQNTGLGPADTIRVTMHMPKGLDLSNFTANNIKTASYSGEQFKNELGLFKVDPANNLIVFKFEPHKYVSKEISLLGTENLINPLSDPRTIGDIEFTVTTTDQADSLLSARASIEFHSKNSTDTSYELPVITNISSVRIVNCCTDCKNCPNCNHIGCYIIAGLCWWWWILIFLLLTMIYIILRRRRRKRGGY